MSDRKRLIERIKSVVLVVLFFTTILLLYLLWGAPKPSLQIQNLLFGSGEESAPRAQDLLVPLYAAFGNADGSFRLAQNTEEIYRAAAQRFSDFSAEGGVVTEEIDEEQYREALTAYESLSLYFGFDVDFSDFCAQLGIGEFSGAEQIGTFQAFSFSDAARESLLLRDSGTRRCYRIVFGVEQNVVAELRALAEESEESLYPAGDILGGDSTALLPLSATSRLRAGSFTAEPDEDRQIEMAEAVFGDTFDFVRRIEDSFGNVTYMYGYGQKTFSAYVDGTYEYKSEVGQGESLGYFGDLQTGVNFAAACGGWEDSLRLSAVRRLEGGRTGGYEYFFVQSADGVPVYTEHHYAAEISVVDGQVIRYLSATADLKPADEGSSRDLIDPANVLANNCNHIYNISSGSMMSIDSEEALGYVADRVSAVRQGYFRSEAEGLLLPCWVVSTDTGACFFFDLYDASPLGFINEEA